MRQINDYYINRKLQFQAVFNILVYYSHQVE